jgi:predicted dehydrogenase
MISILTPSEAHIKNFLQVSKYVKNILIEKPLTTSLEDAKKIFFISKKNRNKVFVVMQNRFNKPILKLKEAIIKNKLRKIFLVTARVRWSRDEKYYNLAKWMGTKKMDGGILFNQAAHHVDMLTWINAPIIKIHSL